MTAAVDLHANQKVAGKRQPLGVPALRPGDMEVEDRQRHRQSLAALDHPDQVGILQIVVGLAVAAVGVGLGDDLGQRLWAGAAPAHQEMMGGRLDVMFDNLSASKQYIQSSRLKGLAVSSAARSAQLPGLPTVNESGIVNFEGESWFGIFAPAGTPAPVVAKLRETLSAINREAEFVAKIERDGGRTLNVPAAQQQTFLHDELARWVGAVNKYGVALD